MASLLLTEVDAEVIPVATEITPVPAVAPVARATVGWVVTLTPVRQLLVVGVPSAVIAAAEEPMVTPVTMESPVPFASVAPVATVFAVPSVGAVLFAPLMMRVSAFAPLPIANDQVDALPALVTFGTVVVTSFLFVSAETDLTKVSVVCAPKPVMAAAVPSAPTAVPEAVALIFVVVGVTVVVKVALVPRALAPLPLFRETVFLDASVPRFDRSPNSIHFVPLKMNSAFP